MNFCPIANFATNHPQSPRFIQTIPKIGYTMIANISDSNFQRPRTVGEEKYGKMQLPSVEMSHNPALFYFVGGILTVVVGLTMLMIILSRLHGGGNL